MRIKKSVQNFFHTLFRENNQTLWFLFHFIEKKHFVLKQRFFEISVVLRSISELVNSKIMIRVGFGIVNYYFFLAPCSLSNELRMYNSRNMEHHKFYQAPSTSNLKACQDLCIADKNCKAFTRSSRTRKCYLQDRIRILNTSSSNWITGVKCDQTMTDKPDYVYTGVAGIET